MCNFFKNIVIAIISLSIVLNFQSCSKENEVNEIDSVNLNDMNTKSWWQVLTGVAAAVIVIIECVEGQYYEKRYYDDNGRLVVESGCHGLGHCAINGKTDSNSALSDSTTYGKIGDYSVNGLLVSTNNGEILFVADTNNNSEVFDRFFYSDTISISRHLIIDNQIVLNRLGIDSSLVIQGSYAVESLTSDRNGLVKYIVLR